MFSFLLNRIRYIILVIIYSWKNNEIDLLIDEYEYDGIYESFIQLDDELVLISTKPNLTVDLNNNNYKIGIVKRNKITNEIYKKQ